MRLLTGENRAPTYVNVKNIHICMYRCVLGPASRQRLEPDAAGSWNGVWESRMTEALGRLESQLDYWGWPAWVFVMVAGFIIFWPIGLAVLGYMIWSGRMGCGRTGGRGRWQRRMAEKWERKMSAFGMQAKAYEPTGNRAFDEYRQETLRRLEEEAREFSYFLDRLRMAKDRQEFEDFMSSRKNPPQSPPTGNGDNGPQPGSVPSA